jgi:glycosyltransferase involved in cell wall biosynthesis
VVSRGRNHEQESCGSRGRYSASNTSNAGSISTRFAALPPRAVRRIGLAWRWPSGVISAAFNEADTLSVCIEKAQKALLDEGIAGEIIIADNGSTDNSTRIAAERGARVVHVKARGYGNALMGGIAAARGKFVIMGDADDSYDFLEIPKFVRKLREGVDLVQGCRLPWGGGRILPGAMPFSHRWFGNPLLSVLVRRMFASKFHDVYCGMRGFTKDFYDRLDQRCTGMEFATEMIIKAGLHQARIAEIPITLLA